MISIDFVAGSHGNFLEFVCNKFIAGLNLDFSPFNGLGASHVKTKNYKDSAVFKANHYSERGIPLSRKIIRITFEHDDLLPLMSVALLRAGDRKINVNQLEVNTYYKLNNVFYKDEIVKINNSYQEVSLSPGTPDCPRHILREFFKYGLWDTTNNGFISKLNALNYTSEYDVVDFKFAWFYNKEVFVENIKNLAKWCKTSITNELALIELHDQFLEKQIFQNDKVICDTIITAVDNRIEQVISDLNILQEAYINGYLEKKYSVEMPFVQPTYFKNTKEILEHLCLRSRT